MTTLRVSVIFGGTCTVVMSGFRLLSGTYVPGNHSHGRLCRSRSSLRSPTRTWFSSRFGSWTLWSRSLAEGLFRLTQWNLLLTSFVMALFSTMMRFAGLASRTSSLIPRVVAPARELDMLGAVRYVVSAQGYVGGALRRVSDVRSGRFPRETNARPLCWESSTMGSVRPGLGGELHRLKTRK